jgi:hypothetical protein
MALSALLLSRTYFTNIGILDVFSYFWKLEGWDIDFLVQFDELYPSITKKEKNSDEILNCGHIRDSVNTLKVEYLGSRSL